MSFLSRQKDESAAIVENTEIPLRKDADNKVRGRITANSPSQQQVRQKKVLAVQQQLAEGRYDLDERLDTALERLLVAVTT
jgi:hypothetical protein